MRRFVAEGLGTFALVLAGVGTAVLGGMGVGVLEISLAFGLALVALIYTIGPISGCHVNPAVTVGLLAARRIGPRVAAGYIVAQCIGAIIAAGVVWFIADTNAVGYSASAQGLGANGFGAHSPGGFGWAGAFVIEILVTGLLVLAVLVATDLWAPLGVAGLAIGVTLAAANLIAIPVDGASVNPARSLGPAVFVGGWALSQLWLFIVAPVIGALLAVAVHSVLRPPWQVRPKLATPLPDESLHEIARETARLIGNGHGEGDGHSHGDGVRVGASVSSDSDGTRASGDGARTRAGAGAGDFDGAPLSSTGRLGSTGRSEVDRGPR
ncbi:aquaporin Z [Parafrankia irregularis]|uniref:Aquaporin Z n=1 Tax=Parafrankia irregularis TaxID=795642 RepID=A0A0S4R0C5_9ACTN|nr:MULTISPECIES: aquaporin [Parafrankia]MBE3204897.1 aquaporin [Parafrankia sp. CH37]CUU60668.1 aquaporin Z [Parafrankia irregularis]